MADEAYRIGVVSDTHLPRFGDRLPAALVAGLTEPRVDLIVHLGDFTGPDVPALLERIAPLAGVAGNNDGEELRRRFPRRLVLEVAGVRLGLVHGDEGRSGTTLRRAQDTFASERLDAILFGHSHIPHLAKHGETWLVNPGSGTDKRREPRYSYATLDVTDGVVLPRLHFYDDRRPE
jgi:putative phosphoesterase